jgi:hypothetical protein
MQVLIFLKKTEASRTKDATLFNRLVCTPSTKHQRTAKAGTRSFSAQHAIA